MSRRLATANFLPIQLSSPRWTTLGVSTPHQGALFCRPTASRSSSFTPLPRTSSFLGRQSVARHRTGRQTKPSINGNTQSTCQLSSVTQHADGKTYKSKGLRFIAIFLGLYTTCGLLYYYEDTTGQETFLTRLLKRVIYGKPLNETTFVPFKVTAKEQVTFNSFILTIRPRSSLGDNQWLNNLRPLNIQEEPVRYALLAGLYAFLPMSRGDLHGSRAVIEKAWEHGMWSVEIKQPQLQIARDYTPLPPLQGNEKEEMRTGDLRFLIRRYDGGEVSTYISRLDVGDGVELRGPHLGFDIRKRLRDAGRIVFLAGGTGIAPAMQMVYRLLRKEEAPPDVDHQASGTRDLPIVSILWANRRREDCIGCRGVRSSGDQSSTPASAIMQQWQEMQQDLSTLSVRCTVDEEHTFIREDNIMPPSIRKGSGINTGQTSSQDCPYHSQSVIERCTDGDDPLQVLCSCDPGPQGGKTGKNIVVVSGPDGFIQAYAGPKRWAGGHELQGPVGGILGNLKSKYPGVFTDWIVLKL